MNTSFRNRWLQVPGGAGRDRLAAIGCASPFGLTDDGLCDFRGIVISESVHGIQVERADLSHSELDGGQLISSFTRCAFRDCRYDGEVGSMFDTCDFSRANLRESVLSGTFRHCTFHSAKMTSVRGRFLRFESCTFVDVDFRKASFYDSSFKGCNIEDSVFMSGSLAGSTFADCRIQGVKFARMVMSRVKGLVV